jgi:ABC-type maltose transport system permease subunit
MRASSVISIATVVTAIVTGVVLCAWSLQRIRFISRHRLVRLRQILKELRHGH